MKKETQNDSELQSILLSKDQYLELLKATSMYALVKEASLNPLHSGREFADYVYDQGKKFGLEKTMATDMEWFEKVTDDVFESLFDFSEQQSWEHFAANLARRDAKIATGATEETMDNEMQTDLFFDIMGKREQAYLEEFGKYGIKNVEVKIMK